MDKLESVKRLFEQIGMPKSQRTDLCSFVLLAMAGLHRDSQWSDATNEWVRIHDVIRFLSESYNVVYAENSRETIRKRAMHPFRTAALIEDNGATTNSPNYRYRITAEFLDVIKGMSDNTSRVSGLNKALRKFISNHESLCQIYASKKQMRKMQVCINHIDFSFSPGKHNELQKAIIEEFAPRFAPDSECLYVGDTIQKDLVRNSDKLAELGFQISIHDKMPDVILYREDKDWIYFIEAITSVGPMNPKRMVEINLMTENLNSGKIFVSAFPDFATFKKFADKLAWETEVWIADMPDHMIHLNGDKFLGPR